MHTHTLTHTDACILYTHACTRPPTHTQHTRTHTRTHACSPPHTHARTHTCTHMFTIIHTLHPPPGTAHQSVPPLAPEAPQDPKPASSGAAVAGSDALPHPMASLDLSDAWGNESGCSDSGGGCSNTDGGCHVVGPPGSGSRSGHGAGEEGGWSSSGVMAVAGATWGDRSAAGSASTGAATATAAGGHATAMTPAATAAPTAPTQSGPDPERKKLEAQLDPRPLVLDPGTLVPDPGPSAPPSEAVPAPPAPPAVVPLGVLLTSALVKGREEKAVASSEGVRRGMGGSGFQSAESLFAQCPGSPAPTGPCLPLPAAGRLPAPAALRGGQRGL